MRRSVFILILILSLGQINAYTLSISQSDTLHTHAGEGISQRQFSADLIQEIKADSDFQYEIPPEVRPNFLQLMFQRLFKWLLGVFGNEFFAWLIIVLMVILGLVGLGFALYGLFGVGKTVPVYVRETNGLDYEVKEEDIHDINFAEEIDIAIEQQQYRKAIRLIYLLALKLLTDRQIISWAPHKTNHDYLQEIKPDAYREKLSTLGYYFEYAWYGDFHVEDGHVREMQNAFKDLEGRLKHA